MRAGRLRAAVSLTVALALFVWAAVGVGRREMREHLAGAKVVRFAHQQLEPGVREVFDAISRDYEALHPGVHIEQISVPQRAWASWMLTRLTGGNPPDLLQLQSNDPNPILRYFQPLGPAVHEPNPYNAGTSLAKVPWKETFIVKLDGVPAYWPWFGDFYGMPQTLFTVRLLYNRDLLTRITGHDRPPRTLQEFLDLGERVQRWSANQTRSVTLVAGSRFHGPLLLDPLFGSQTQIYWDRLDPRRRFGLGHDSAAPAYTLGRWSLRDDAVQSGLRLVQRVGAQFQPGFLLADRGDPLFYFEQQRALMIAVGSWEQRAISSQVGFATGALALPFPDRDDPEFGRFVLGPQSEANLPLRVAFALTQASRHADIALDFLRFLTSQQQHRRLVAATGWLPVIQGVDPAPGSEVFAPFLEGYPFGFSPGLGVETLQLWLNLQPALYSRASVENITRQLEAGYAEALVGDLRKERREQPRIMGVLDTLLAADAALQADGAAPYYSGDRRTEMQERQALSEAGYFSGRALLRRYAAQEGLTP